MPVSFYKHGGNYHFSAVDENQRLDHLPAAVYELIVMESPISGPTIMFRPLGERFRISEKVYGRHKKLVNRIVEEYDRMNPPLGVIAVGQKGSGKSMMCEDIGNRMISQGLPVIMVNSQIRAEILRGVFDTVGPCVVYYDEFGKIYRGDSDRESLLTFFSDQNALGRMTLVTANSPEELSEFMVNRPGRFKYRVEFDTLDREALQEILEEYQVPTHKARWLSSSWNSLTYDQVRFIMPILRSVQNREELAKELDIMNVARASPYHFTVTVDATKLPPESVLGSVDFDGDVIHIKILHGSGTTEISIPVWNGRILHNPRPIFPRSYGLKNKAGNSIVVTLNMGAFDSHIDYNEGVIFQEEKSITFGHEGFMYRVTASFPAAAKLKTDTSVSESSNKSEKMVEDDPIKSAISDGTVRKLVAQWMPTFSFIGSGYDDDPAVKVS